MQTHPDEGTIAHSLLFTFPPPPALTPSTVPFFTSLPPFLPPTSHTYWPQTSKHNGSFSVNISYLVTSA